MLIRIIIVIQQRNDFITLEEIVMANSEEEIWKAHPEYAGTEVSTFGRVRTLDRVVPSKGNGTRFVKGRILKQYNDHGGYLQAPIKVGKKWILKRVHRLVAQTFLPNLDNLPMVNHKDCNIKNNNVENLEWCTASYNARYREKYGVSRIKAAGQPLFAINLATLEVSQFPSRTEAGIAFGIDSSRITAVIKGSRKQTGGFWFVNDDGHAVDAVKSKLHDVGGTVRWTAVLATSS